MEAQPVPAVLRKKKKKIQLAKFEAEGYIITNSRLTSVLDPRPSKLRKVSTSMPNVTEVTPGKIFKAMFGRATFTELKEQANEEIIEKHEGLPITKVELCKYLGTLIHMCLSPLGRMSDHWKDENKEPGQLTRRRWELIHRRRNFRTGRMFNLLSANYAKFISDPGSEMTVDELQAGFSGNSPMLNYNDSKPAPWGNLFFMNTILVCGRPYTLAFIGRHPGLQSKKRKEGDAWMNPSTAEIFEILDDHLVSHFSDKLEFHYTTDSYYSGKDVRALLRSHHRYFTMGSRADWLPLVYNVLEDKLPYGEHKTAYLPKEQTHFVATSSEKMKYTLSNNAQAMPDQPLASAAEDSFIFTAYRQRFNTVDLFNRLFYLLPFPHCHTTWKDHFYYVFFKITLVNAYTMAIALTTRKNMLLRTFMEEVADELLASN